MHELQDDEFRRTHGSQSDLDDQSAGPYILFSHRLSQTDMHKESFLRRSSHQGA